MNSNHRNIRWCDQPLHTAAVLQSHPSGAKHDGSRLLPDGALVGLRPADLARERVAPHLSRCFVLHTSMPFKMLRSTLGHLRERSKISTTQNLQPYTYWDGVGASRSHANKLRNVSGRCFLKLRTPGHSIRTWDGRPSSRGPCTRPTHPDDRQRHARGRPPRTRSTHPSATTSPSCAAACGPNGRGNRLRWPGRGGASSLLAQITERGGNYKAV